MPHLDADPPPICRLSVHKPQFLPIYSVRNHQIDAEPPSRRGFEKFDSDQNRRWVSLRTVCLVLSFLIN